jgi:hypothetical protein
VPLNIIAWMFLKCCLCNAEGGMRNDILFGNREQSGKGASSSENESVAEGSMDEVSD